MSSFTTLLRRMLPTDDGNDVLYECRNCGTSLDDDQRQCPHCGSDETIEYELE